MIIGIIGDRGCGKTLFMVREALLNYKKHQRIVSNFHLTFPKIKGSKKPELVTMDMITNFKAQLKNMCLFLDEIYVYIDSRNSSSKANRIWSYFFNQTRKRGVDLYYSTQFFHQVDKRLRSNTELFVFPKKIVKDEKIYIIITLKNRGLKTLKKYIFEGNNYFNYYDTDEIIDITEE